MDQNRSASSKSAVKVPGHDSGVNTQRIVQLAMSEMGIAGVAGMRTASPPPLEYVPIPPMGDPHHLLDHQPVLFVTRSVP